MGLCQLEFIFVSFMLELIRELLQEIVDNQKKHINVRRNVGINKQDMSVEERVLQLLKDGPKMTAKQLSDNLGLSGRQVERIISRLKAEGKLERVGANKNGSWKVL